MAKVLLFIIQDIQIYFLTPSRALYKPTNNCYRTEWITLITEDDMDDSTKSISQALFFSCVAHLTQMAHTALSWPGMTREDFFLYCIAVDSRWHEVVDELHPAGDWEPIRARGKAPLAIGAATWNQLRPLWEQLPDICRVTHIPLSEDHVRVLVVHEQGWAAIELLVPPQQTH